MQTDLRHYYLQQMGVDVWQRRLYQREQNELEQLIRKAKSCTQCVLHQGRTQTVFGRGTHHAKLMIIGEAPGFNEDQQGLPFVGKAGKLLSTMLKTIGLSDEDVYITNILKCRPPNNRDPKPDEIKACGGYLTQQINLINPDLILAVGRFSGQFLLNQTLSLSKMRNQTYNYQGKTVVVSYHPAYLLRNPKDKKKSYADLLRVQRLLLENS